MRDKSLNSQYLVHFKSVRQVGQISTLARQMNCPHLIDVYREVIAVGYQPLIADLRPQPQTI